MSLCGWNKSDLDILLNSPGIEFVVTTWVISGQSHIEHALFVLGMYMSPVLPE